MILSNTNTSLIKNKLYARNLVANNPLETIPESLSESGLNFLEFFSNISKPVFTPLIIDPKNLVSSSDYNSNLKQIYLDIKSFYEEIDILSKTQVSSYNFALTSVLEVVNAADKLSSTVIDLNILSNFNRQDMIVAGDDFKDMSYIDTSAGTASSFAEILIDGGGIGLARESSEEIPLDAIDVKIIPLSPRTSDDVNTKPTAGNFERFYEGSYYGFIGLARPEGDIFNIRYIKSPDERGFKDVPKGDVQISSSPGGSKRVDGADNPDGYFLDFGASEEVKKQIRLRMFDKNPNSFWEAEYLYKLPSSLIGDVSSGPVVEDGSSENRDIPEAGVITIDLDQANNLAKNFDFAGRDLSLEIIVTLNEPKNINFIAINPIIFGEGVFPVVSDIATAGPDEAAFITVDNWNTTEFAKTITPEANEFLTDSELRTTLAPNRYSYRGQGIFPFPVRYAKKVKITLNVSEPVAQPYDKTVVLLKKTINIKGEITTRTKKGLFA